MDARAEILSFDPEIPIGRARTPPASWYVEPAFDALERAVVFRRTWQPVCRAEEVAVPGAYVAGRSFGLSWVVVRGDDGVLRAFANTCRHKATEVCAGAGTVPHLTCPYHGWTYRLDGSLKSAPRMAGLEALDRAAMALPSFGVEIWGPLVLIHPDPGAPAFQPTVAGLGAALDATGWTGLAWHGRRTYEVACNWKAYCDNYLDGGYHVSHVHPSLAGQLDLDAYRTELYGRYNVQSCPSREGRVAGRTGGGALYAWIYPNLMINRYGPCLDTNIVHPISERRCRVIFDFWFEPEQARDARWVGSSLDDSERTQLEDMDVSERVQIGMETGTWRNGPYAPKIEVGIHHFHRLLAADLRAGIDG